MRWEVRRLQRQLDITTVFVTHDQEEALAISDRIVVMNAGRIEQVGAPSAIYRTPRTLFVARFIGESNLWEGTVGGRLPDGVRFVTATGLELLVEDAGDAAEGARAVAGVRPEAVAIGRNRRNGHGAIPESRRGHGGGRELRRRLDRPYRVRVGPELTVLVRRPNAESDGGKPPALNAGDRVALGWPASAGRVIRPA
jgi:ABC-type Fe3+/spermidine/putrescine transport system ATPase subunit